MISGAGSSTTTLADVLANTSGVQLFTRESRNRVDVTAWTADHIGYLDKNKSMLQVIGTITQDAPVAMHAFMFRRGEELQLFSNSNPGTRIQIMDSNGRKVFADSHSDDPVLLENYAKLMAGKLDIPNGNYILKVSRDMNTVSKFATLNYDIRLSSGDSYTQRYQTKAGAMTILQHLQEQGTLGYNAASITAAVMLSNSEGEGLNIFDFFV